MTRTAVLLLAAILTNGCTYVTESTGTVSSPAGICGDVDLATEPPDMAHVPADLTQVPQDFTGGAGAWALLRQPPAGVDNVSESCGAVITIPLSAPTMEGDTLTVDARTYTGGYVSGCFVLDGDGVEVDMTLEATYGGSITPFWWFDLHTAPAGVEAVYCQTYACSNGGTDRYGLSVLDWRSTVGPFDATAHGTHNANGLVSSGEITVSQQSLVCMPMDAWAYSPEMNPPTEWDELVRRSSCLGHWTSIICGVVPAGTYSATWTGGTHLPRCDGQGGTKDDPNPGDAWALSMQILTL